VPSAKKILVNGSDDTGIPAQFPIHEVWKIKFFLFK
jgi:hypothetical protein